MCEYNIADANARPVPPDATLAKKNGARASDLP